MKLKAFYYSVAILIVAAGLTFTSCKKTDFDKEDGQASSDNRDVQSENDAATNDVNDAIGQQATLHGRGVDVVRTTGVTGNICGLTIDTTGMVAGTIKLNYNGTSCNNRTRTGSIRLTIQDFVNGKRWKNVGCILKVEYLAYKITRTSDGKSIQLDGTQYITNETGGTWWELLILKTQSSLATSVKGTDLNVTFDDGKTAIYNINRKITYTLPGGIITCTGEGIGSSNGLSNLENYGTTRDGHAFTSQVTTPIVWNLTCGANAPVQGAVDIKVADKEFDLKCTFGVDSKGNTVTPAPNSCAYGWKVEWTYKKKTNNKIFNYK
jgi:hypothetical protein